eukprot:11515903-Ditylum_brightwellii.AAC.1
MSEREGEGGMPFSISSSTTSSWTFVLCITLLLLAMKRVRLVNGVGDVVHAIAEAASRAVDTSPKLRFMIFVLFVLSTRIIVLYTNSDGLAFERKMGI